MRIIGKGPFYELIYDEDKDYYITVVNLGYFSFSAKKKNYQAGEVSFFPIRVEPGLHYAKTSLWNRSMV